MSRRMFGNLSARRAQLRHGLETLRHAHLWTRHDRPQGDHPISESVQETAQIGPPDPTTATRGQPLGDAAALEQRNALNGWEDEGGTTKLVSPR